MKQLEEDLRFAVRHTVHYTAKSKNTNASKSGVRLASSEKLKNFPYICGKVVVDDLKVDWVGSEKESQPYVKSPMKTFKMKDFINTINKDLKKKDEIHEHNEKMLQALTTDDNHHETLSDVISKQETQIRLPYNDGYISVTPLTANGLAGILVDVFRIYEKQDKNHSIKKPAKTIKIHCGTNLASNAGTLLSKNPSLIYIKPPTVSISIKEAYKQHFNLKPKYRISHEEIEKLCDIHENSFLNSLVKDEKYTIILKGIVERVLNTGKHIRNNLEEHIKEMPNNELLAKRNTVYSGIVLEEDRNHQWKEKFAIHIVERIVNFKRKKDKSIDFDDVQRKLFKKIILRYL